jgi:hypothetical protein
MLLVKGAIREYYSSDVYHELIVALTKYAGQAPHIYLRAYQHGAARTIELLHANPLAAYCGYSSGSTWRQMCEVLNWCCAELVCYDNASEAPRFGETDVRPLEDVLNGVGH